MYEDGRPTEFEPPGKPEKPCATKKSESSVTLEWKESQLGISLVQKYIVHFRRVVRDSS